MKHYILGAAGPEELWVVGVGKHDYQLARKRIYRSQKGEYVRVNIGDNRHRRKYLKEMERVKIVRA